MTMPEELNMDRSSPEKEQSAQKNQVRAHIVVDGRVQGVSYRAFTQQQASRLHLHGWVRNLPSGQVECEVEGPPEFVESFLTFLRKGPALAQVAHVQVNWISVVNDVEAFRIIRS
ncbi:acylphosphatase [Nitrospira sp. M1]